MASKLKKILGGIAQVGLPILGGMLGGPVGAGIGGAAGGALSGKKGALKQAGIGALTGFGGAKLLGMGGSSAGTNPLSKVNSYVNPMANFSAPTSAGSTGGGGFNLGNIFKQQSTNKSGGFGLSKLTENPLQLGLGTMLASQFIKSPQVPESPQSVIDFQNAARQGNPLQNQAASALSQQLGQTQQDMSQDEMNALNRQYDLAMEQELKSIDSMYKSLRPGTDPLTDSAYQKDLGQVRDRYATLRADSAAQMQRQISNDFASQRGQQIAQAAGLGEQQLQQLAQLSQYDLDRVMDQMAMDYNDKSALRNYLLQLGGNIAASGFQKNPLYASPFGGQN